MSQRLNIVADAHIWAVKSAFSELPGYNVELQILEHQHIEREVLKDVDILLTRSSTRVNAELMEGTAVRFAATATIGDDHYDKAWLDTNNVTWANAAGSSTGSVVEYMITSLLELHVQNLISIPDTTIGIIGAGRIGSAFADICRAIGMKVLINDPPRQRIEGDAGFCSLDELLESADILTLHTPLIPDTEDCTLHLLNAKRLSKFQGRGVINAGRGACIDNAALKDWLDRDISHFAALDCWENEPGPLLRLLRHPQLVIATPHIAGHSIDGKAANTQFVYNALCNYLKVTPVWDMHEHLPVEASPVKIKTATDPWFNLHAAAKRLYALSEDHKAMKSWFCLTETELVNAFTGYRRHYPVRRAWQHAPIYFSRPDATTNQLAQAMGMKIV
jgi:erythronate-4-phosphate dehydrogenase